MTSTTSPIAPSVTSSPSDGGSSEEGKLSTSDIVGIAVGAPSAVIALVSAVLAYCAWRYPKSPVGKLGKSVGHLIRRGGDAHGGDAEARDARGGNAYGASVQASGDKDAIGGTGRGGHAKGEDRAQGGDAFGGEVSEAPRESV